MSQNYSLDHVMTYMRTHFLTLSQLAGESQTSICEIHNLILSGCIPAASYMVRETVTLNSALNETVEVDADNVIEYHSPSTVDWIRLAEKLAKETSDGNLLHVAQLMRFHFESEFALALKEFDGIRYGYSGCFLSESELSRDRLHQVVNEEWNKVLKGAYGISLRLPVSARSIVRKGVTIARLAELTHNGAKDVLTEEERLKVIEAMKEFNSIVSEFSPHDRIHSLRKRYFDDFVTKYGLQDHFQRVLYPRSDEVTATLQSNPEPSAAIVFR